MLYRLGVNANDEFHYVVLAKHEDKLFKFVVLNENDSSFLQHVILFKAQIGFLNKNLNDFDFLETFMGIPVFSERFAQILADTLKDEMTFFPCKVLFEENAYKFYLGKIHKLLPLVNKAKSEYLTLTDGSEILDKVAFRKDLPDFYITRSEEEPTLFVISDKLAELIRNNHLNVKLTPQDQSD